MPLSVYQIPLQKKLIRAEFHPKNNSVIVLYDDGEMQSISSEGKENWTLSFKCDPISFKVNADGDLVAVLGKEKLFFYNLLTTQTTHIDVDEKIQLLEFYKNSVLLSGFQDNIILVKSNGSIQKTIKFDFLIRQFKVVSITNHLLIYNQDHKLLSADMNGNILWLLENLIIHNEILVCEKGHIGYFILDPNDLIQFHVRGEYFNEVTDERVIKSFSPSMDGKNLLILDAENTLIMFNENANKIWDYKFEHNISNIKMSSNGDFFFTIDNDEILSCYATDSADKERGDFFEIKDDKRVLDKETTWTIRPGGYSKTAPLRLLTVNAGGYVFGLIGRDGYVSFYDERGVYKYNTSFTTMVEVIGISDNSQYGYIHGGNEMMIVDFQNKEKRYILFEKSFLGKPLINYHHQKIFAVSKEKELLIYDFKSHLINTIPLKKDYKKGISCEAYGAILFNDKEIKGFTGEGKAILNYPLEGKILNIFYSDPVLIYSTKDRFIFKIDLSNLKGKKKAIEGGKEDLMIVSVNPLFIITGNETLHHLDSNLSTISTHRIESPDSLFYIDDGHFYEITRRHDRFYCYNDKREMIWRYISKERIKECALMRSGMVFVTQDSVQYLEIKHKSEYRKHYSQYLEI
jgi:hypothetical protein